MRDAGGVEAVTLGCRLNGVESETMVRLAEASGRGPLAIVNTCAVTAEAVRQSRQAIRRLRREAPDRPIVATGCAATIDPAAFGAMPEVARVLANRDKADPAQWGAPVALPAAAPSQRTRGFLEVQTGCDHRCTFCIIPAGRGASRSIAPDVVVARARALVEAGAREIVLTGVDVTAYGLDLTGRPGLGALVSRLLHDIPALPRLRLSSLDCIEADAALVEAIGTEPRLMPHLHLSLQAGSDLVLKRMKRRHSRAEAVAFCAALRAARPDIVFGADIITGFPTETEAMFADSLALVEACGLTHLHVFPFSPRPGTPAARMPQVEPAVARERAARLRAVGARATQRHLAAQVGRSLTVLMERGGRGRAADFTPVQPDAAVPAGRFAEVMVDAVAGDHVRGRLIGPPAAG